ncbi:dTDP-4-amino-4,6-dideoxygalactose transaminase [Hymenobacter busanensis]|uniref:dTDP-4-amino-4,6-dideoxygalactose transaminase n=1 Tax=Hymenobacter busanensis TaxID=2607656 RepID=A0A7L4ZX06_9BACT|nr:dTDP-4-amino-4,6-dideoxygalactose transaminase [Hymenobacter busanensis]KAA9332278.1 dTDP-4-amino-4,6-dideoxygalactose transaminase [Hymenobacter busanensis]QHJ07385.1 dTDP-4-amino-4,6-dideoxygalactose transaminase [Hymenobacter busanensis]
MLSSTHPDFIPFNRPHLAGPELMYIQQAVAAGKLSGNGQFTQRCQRFFEQQYGIGKALLTTSGTAALEMAALLLNLQPGDEVIVPSYTFTSTANAFVLRGARIVFADSCADHPNLDPAEVARLITPRTRAIVPVHYAGAACDMDALLALARQHGLWVVEDAAQAIEGYYRGKRLGTLGHLAAFSFHETKNISAGEGGLLAVNDPQLAARAEIIWEKGTNRAAFFRGEAARYEWVDIGSSFLPSELNAAYLWAQLEALADIQRRREHLWRRYAEAFEPLRDAGYFELLPVPAGATSNWHLFAVVCRSQTERDALLAYLTSQHILAVFHYLPLHASPFYHARHDGRPLPHAERFGRCLVRLPLFYDLTPEQQDRVVAAVLAFYAGREASSSS